LLTTFFTVYKCYLPPVERNIWWTLLWVSANQNPNFLSAFTETEH